MKTYPQNLFSFYDNALETEAECLQEANEWGRASMFSDMPEGVGFAIESDVGIPIYFLLEDVVRDTDDNILYWQLAPIDLPEYPDLKVVVLP